MRGSAAFSPWISLARQSGTNVQRQVLLAAVLLHMHQFSSSVSCTGA